MSKSTILCEVHALLHEGLYGERPWFGCEDKTVSQQFLELGLWEVVDERGAWGSTALGLELNAKLLSVFAGNWVDDEMPMILRENGLITEDEEDEIYLRFEGQETSEEILRPVVQRAFVDYFRSSVIAS